MFPMRRIYGTGALSALLLAAFTAGASDWSIKFDGHGLPLIRFRGAPVLRAKYMFFYGAQWRSPMLRVEPDEDGGLQVYGDIQDTEITVQGSVLEDKSKGYTFSYTVNLPQPQNGRGFGIEFTFDLNSPAFPNKPPPPVEVGNKQGWKWSLNSRDIILFTASKPLGEIVKPRNNPGTVAVYLLPNKTPAGKYTVVFNLGLPRGWETEKDEADRYPPADASTWFENSVVYDEAPVDLTFLNEKPAGKHGFLKVKDDRFVFEDGTEARFWGTCINGRALFAADENIDGHAWRLARYGFNLVRITGHDWEWSNPNIFGDHKDGKAPSSLAIDPAKLERIDRWINALKDQGIYVWLDVHCNRRLQKEDYKSEKYGDLPGAKEIRRAHGDIAGFCYFNETLERMMNDFMETLLNHVNPHTGLAYKDDPAIVMLQLSDDDDIIQHRRYVIRDITRQGRGQDSYSREKLQDFIAEYARDVRYPADMFFRASGRGKLTAFFNNLQHEFYARMRGRLEKIGFKIPVSGTGAQADSNFHCLPFQAGEDFVSVFLDLPAEPLTVNPSYEADVAAKLNAMQIIDKPFVVNRWSAPLTDTDRCVYPLYLAAVGRLQGWDTMIYYSYVINEQIETSPSRIDPRAGYVDPAIMAPMPAAALLFRRGDVKEARRTYGLELKENELLDATKSSTGLLAPRTLTEISRVGLLIPRERDLDWLKPSKRSGRVSKINDPNKDFISRSSKSVKSDTRELEHNFVTGWQKIDTPRLQAAIGWIGGEKIKTRDVQFRIETGKAVVCVASLTDAAIRKSDRLLVTIVARAVCGDNNTMPIRSEPVTGELKLKTRVKLALFPLSSDGSEGDEISMEAKGGSYTIRLTPKLKTHWLILHPGGETE